MARSLELSSSSLSSHQKLGEILVEMNLISTDQLNEAIQRGVQKRTRIGDLLVNEGFITPVDLAKALAQQYQMEYVDLESMIFNKDAAKILPEKIARNFLIVPIESKDGVITLATYDPIQLIKLDNLKDRLNGTIILRVSTKQQIETALNKVYSQENSVEKIVKHLAKKQVRKDPLKSSGVLDSSFVHSTRDNSAPSIESLVNKFLEKAVNERASDIHIDPSEENVRVRVRIDGILHELYNYPAELHPAVVSRLKVLANLDISEKRNPQDGRFHHPFGTRPIDIRVSTLPTVRGEKIVMRLLDKEKMKGTLSQIGMSPEIEAEVQALLQRPFGMLFITGPTGSGKTTTLYSMLNQLNGVEKNIITVEDPVEYKFDVINQVQVNEKAGLNFAGLLRNILRQDPDVLMIGEVRDQETADIAIRAALTGHLVLSTLHTNDAVSTPNRLIDMGIESYLLSSALIGVLAQRLVRVLCTHCRKKVFLTEEDIRLLGTSALSTQTAVYGPVGCKQCVNTGYQNRIALFELMIIDDEVKRAIIERKPESEITEHLINSGFISMRQDGIYKIAAGITSVEEVLKATL